MKENKGVYIEMCIEKEEIQNILNVMKNKAYDKTMGIISLSITVGGEGFIIPIQAKNEISKRTIERLINNGKYNFQNGDINLLYQLIPVDAKEEDTKTDLMSF